MATLALLVCAPAAIASTASVRDGATVVYAGDPAADTVTLTRFVVGDDAYYTYTDSGGITPGPGCFSWTSTMSTCEVTAGLKRYENDRLMGRGRHRHAQRR